MELKFPLKLWLLTIALGPVVMFVWGLLDTESRWLLEDGLMIFLSFVFSIVLSIPVLAICYLTYMTMAGKGFRRRTVELTVCLMSLIGVWVTLLLMFGAESFRPSDNRDGLTIAGIYSVSVVLSALGLMVFRRSVKAPS